MCVVRVMFEGLARHRCQGASVCMCLFVCAQRMCTCEREGGGGAERVEVRIRVTMLKDSRVGIAFRVVGGYARACVYVCVCVCVYVCLCGRAVWPPRVHTKLACELIYMPSNEYDLS